MNVTCTPKIKDNGTADDGKPPYTSPRWATYALKWPVERNNDDMPDHRPFKHFSDDFVECKSYRMAIARIRFDCHPTYIGNEAPDSGLAEK